MEQWKKDMLNNRLQYLETNFKYMQSKHPKKYTTRIKTCQANISKIKAQLNES